MADCSASGTALDRVIHGAASALAGGSNATSSASAAAASRHAMHAFGNLVGNASTGAVGSAMGSTMDGKAMVVVNPMVGSGGVLPMRPLETMGAVGANRRLDEAWAASSPSMHSAHPSMHPSMQQPTTMHPVHHVHPMQHPQMQMQSQMQMQMQPQMQMAMMQQMQMVQQQQMAMMQFQRQQQQMAQQAQQLQKARQKEVLKAKETQPEAEYEPETDTETQDLAQETPFSSADDDVVTVPEQEDIENETHHEGITDTVTIERLAQAWRDAEEEFAEEFDDYDATDMAAMFSDSQGLDSQTATGTAVGATTETHVEPPYEFSEASRTYGCLLTAETDLAPTLAPADMANPAPPENLYEEGLQNFREGNIATAILCFESTLRNIDPEHADAWRMLGKCHTENDNDAKSIACYVRSLERDPFSSETLLALGVSYVNELELEKAVETLQLWVDHHPVYAGMEAGNVTLQGKMNTNLPPSTVAKMQAVESLLLRALSYDSSADAAADVHETLGVVYNVQRDYDAAVTSFEQAISLRPDDYQLHNKLGATLANGNRSEEALPSYQHALALKPKYARAWLNMAISHSNLHNYEEAARCYLQTLALNPEARHVWSYLRIALTCSERWDLLPLAAKMDLASFRQYFDFVDY